MKENIQNLIKNAIQENAVKFKDQASQVLYSKVGNRLKQEYINVSKSLFKNINEAAEAMPDVMYAPDEAMAAPPSRGTGGSGTGPGGGRGGRQGWTPPNNAHPGPPPENPFGPGGTLPPRPDPNDPKYSGPNGQEQYKKDLYEWETTWKPAWDKYKKALDAWNKQYQRWRQRPPTHGPGVTPQRP